MDRRLSWPRTLTVLGIAASALAVFWWVTGPSADTSPAAPVAAAPPTGESASSGPSATSTPPDRDAVEEEIIRRFREYIDLSGAIAADPSRDVDDLRPYVAGAQAAEQLPGLRSYRETNLRVLHAERDLRRAEVTQLRLDTDPPRAMLRICMQEDVALRDASGRRAWQGKYEGTYDVEYRNGHWVFVDRDGILWNGETCP